MSDGRAQCPQEAEIPDASAPASGVDRAQIYEMLELSPVERLRLLEDWLDGIAELRGLLNKDKSTASTG